MGNAAEARSARGSGSVLGIIFLIVFLDIAGFAVIFPLFPSLLEHYVRLEGPESWVGWLARWLEGLSAGDRNAVVTLFGGVLGSLYAIAQFLLSPVWGGLSDRIGRRATLLVTIGGTALGYVLWMFAGSFATLVAARLLNGAMAGNIATAAAAAADVSSGRERAKAMGIVGMAIGLGFLVGPAIGGAAAAEILRLDRAWPAGAALGLNPFSTPALAALVLSLFNLVWVAVRFPETLPAERRGRELVHTLRPFQRIRSLDRPGVVRTHWIYFVYLTAFAAMEFTLTFLAVERLQYGIGDITWMFVYSGVLIAVVQGGVVRRAVPHFGERAVARAGMMGIVPGLLAIAFARDSTALYAGLTLLAAGSGLAMPSLSALVSRYVPADRQGLAQGTLRSLGSLSRAVGPVLGGGLYWRLGSSAPYLIGAAVLTLPILWTFSLPPVPEESGGG